MLKKINLKNKTALVTGAGKGLGKACAIALAEAGAKVILLSRTKSDLNKVKKIIKKTKGSSQSFVCDVTNLDNLKKAIKAITKNDSELAEYIIKKDEELNALESEIDDLVIKTIALRQPVADDLRLLFAAIIDRQEFVSP